MAQPEYKLLSVRGIPLIADKSMQFSSYQWRGLLKHLTQMLIADAPMEEGMYIPLKCHIKLLSSICSVDMS